MRLTLKERVDAFETYLNRRIKNKEELGELEDAYQTGLILTQFRLCMELEE